MQRDNVIQVQSKQDSIPPVPLESVQSEDTSVSPECVLAESEPVPVDGNDSGAGDAYDNKSSAEAGSLDTLILDEARELDPMACVKVSEMDTSELGEEDVV